jgi:ankyrin repeat protein
MTSTKPILSKLIENGEKIEYIKILLENGSDANSQDIEGKTPLHYTMKYFVSKNEKNISKTDVLKLLLDNGANPDIQDKDGMTPLHYCFSEKDRNFYNKDYKIYNKEAKMLLEYNANPNITNKNDRSCLYYALKNCKSDIDLEIIDLLLNKKVDLYNGNNRNSSPLWALLENYSYCSTIKNKLLKSLIDNDVNFNIEFYIQDIEFTTGYTYAGEPINKTISYNTSPLIWSLENELYDIAVLLIKKNIDLKYKGGLSNATALELACLKDNPQMIKLILSELKNKGKVSVSWDKELEKKDQTQHYDVM